MKNSTNSGFDQHYNCQVIVDHDSRLIVSHAVSNHPSDRGEAVTGLDSIPANVGSPAAACFDNGFWTPSLVEVLLARDITPYIAVLKVTHGLNGQRFFQMTSTTPPPTTPVRW